ncbi:MAG TPA: hypothetical protein P5079_11745, partial [Elusimicrobiota bacterium]|nr:hypothetical protein [Elusimicrobiota bacterium]
MQKKHLPLLLAVLAFAVTFFVYWPAVHNGFVSWDDEANFLNNPAYRGLGGTQLRWMWTTLHMGHYIPVTWMTLGFDYVLWGMDPRGYHLTNLLLHSLNAAFFYLLVSWLFRKYASSSESAVMEPAALAAALFFSLHPLRVESVAWVTERRDLLAGVFFFGALAAYFKYVSLRRDGESAVFGEAGRSRRWYGVSVALFALALLSKATVLMLPVVLLLFDLYPLRRLRREGDSPPKLTGGRLLIEKVPFLVLSLAAGVVLLAA